MCGEQGFIAVRKTVHLVRFIGKGCFSSTYVTLPDSYGLVAAQQQNKLIKFPVCATVGVLFTLDILSQACEKHMQTRFSF